MSSVSGPKPGVGISRRSFIQAAGLGAVGLALGGVAVNKTEAKQSAFQSPKRPNILFITTDEFRWDALGVAGNRVVQTPNLDRMAAEGAHFTQTYCQGPLCQPSRASLLTGRYVHEHGHSWNRMLMNPDWPTMAKQLQKNGYRTAVIGKTHFYDRPPARSHDFRENAFFVRKFGFDDVIEEYDKYLHAVPNIVTPYTEYLKEKGLLETYLAETPSLQALRGDPRKYWEPGTSKLPQEHDLTSFITRAAVDWLEKYDSDKPFFLWLSYVAPHPPLIDDPTWATAYQGKNMPLGPQDKPDTPGNAWGRYLRAWMRGTAVDRLTPEVIAECARSYFGMISLIDQGIGDLQSLLRKRNLDDKTWAFFTADHGEMLGDHGLMFKNVFYKGSVLVPGIIRPPLGMPQRQVSGPIESIDLTATMLDVTGAEPVEGLRGQNLVPEMNGERNGRDVVFSELAGHGNRGNFFVMAATDRYRYTFDKQNDIACELFDLKKDPSESHNLVDDPAFKGVRQDMHKDYYQPFVEGKIG